MMTFGYCALERFGPVDGDPWRTYLKGAGIKGVDEIISLDGLLCPSVINPEHIADGNHLVPNENGFILLDDLGYLQERLIGVDRHKANLIWTTREPQAGVRIQAPSPSFVFKGYDLVERRGDISALTNCGGWPEFSSFEFSRWGLLLDLGEAIELKRVLRLHHPGEHHADCDIWAIFREESGE
jgi:hypothetical protein